MSRISAARPFRASRRVHARQDARAVARCPGASADGFALGLCHPLSTNRLGGVPHAARTASKASLRIVAIDSGWRRSKAGRLPIPLRCGGAAFAPSRRRSLDQEGRAARRGDIGFQHLERIVSRHRRRRLAGWRAIARAALAYLIGKRSLRFRLQPRRGVCPAQRPDPGVRLARR